jgi:hypothetical protein
MKKIATALATLGLLATLAVPAGAAFRPDSASPRRGSAGRPHACYGHHSQGGTDYCTDERRPQHDGRGSILF